MSVKPRGTGLGHILSNSSWLMGEQIIRLTISFALSLWLARQLGPTGFGQLSYAVTFCSIIGIFTTLGLNRILVRDLVTHADDPGHCRKLISTSLAMRLAAAGVAFTLCLMLAWRSGGREALLISWIAAGFFFNFSEYLSLYFQAREAIRPATLARLTPLLFTTGLRIALLLSDADVLLFAMMLLLEQMAGALMLLMAYRRHGVGFSAQQVDWQLARQLLHESWPEIIAGFSGLLFMRIDQVMLQHMIGAAAVGTYALASRLSELWYFMPSAIVAATFPRIIEKRADKASYLASLETLMTTLAGLSYLAVLAVYLLGAPVMHWLYGDAYHESAQILLILIWCGLFASLGLASGSWIMAEKKVALNLYRNLAGALINIPLNLVLIPTYGALGAAYATLIAMMTAYLAFDFCLPSMKDMRTVKLRALLLLPRLRRHRTAPTSR